MKMYHNPGESGKSIYAVCFNDVGQAWKTSTSTFTTYTTTRDDFDINLPEIGLTGYYGPIDLPGLGSNRTWFIYVREGGSPSHSNDTLVGTGFETIDSNVVIWNGDSVFVEDFPNRFETIFYAIDSIYTTILTTVVENINFIRGMIGTGFTGEGATTIYGFLRAVCSKDVATPDGLVDFDPATDSLEAHTDSNIIVKEISTAGMAKLLTVDTGETSAAAGSVGKISQGTSDPETFFDAPLGVLADHPAGSMGQRLLRIPDAAPSGLGGLPTVNAGNLVAGIQSVANITSSGAPIATDGDGFVTVISNLDKDGYQLSAGGNISVADAVSIQAAIATLITDAAAAKTAAQASVYYADLSFIKDGTNDEYTIQWFKDGAPITSGITTPLIQVIKRSDGSDLVVSSALTQIGSTGCYKLDATTTARLAVGDSALVILTATIDAGTRTWRHVIGKDIAS